MFSLLGRFTHRWRWAVVLVTVVAVPLAGLWGAGVFGVLSTSGYDAPGTETARVNALLEEAEGAGGERVDAVAVYTLPAGTDHSAAVDEPAHAAALQEVFDRLPGEHVESVLHHRDPGPYDPDLYISEDQRSTYLALTLTGADETERLTSYQAVLEHLPADGFEHHLGGQLTSVHELQVIAENDLFTAQLIALPLLFLLLVVVFRGLVAALLPLVLGVLSIIGATALLRLWTQVTEVSVFALQITVLLGLGLAIDYGLFVVGRFRDELARTGDVAAALPPTLATAGRTVAYSGITVAIALCGMLLLPQPISHSIGLGGISVVLLNIVAAVVVLPALLAVLGHRVNRLALPIRALTSPGSVTGLWERLANRVMRRPWLSLTAVTAVLVLAALPLLNLSAGTVSHRYLPPDNDGQISSRILEQEFPAGGPASAVLDVAVVGEGAADPVGLESFADRLDTLPGASGARIEHAAEGLAHLWVSYDGAPDDPVNLDLVRAIRAEPAPPGAQEVLVGGVGTPAATLDDTEATLAALPGVLAFVVAATLVLLGLAFRSVVLPVKAVLAAVLSLAATFGLLTWAIQEGGLAPLLGFAPVGTTDLWLYGIVLVIAFGLTTDYELFIVSRAREEYQRTGDTARSVAGALQQTGGVVSGAALLMVVVLATTGIVSDSLVITTLGIGLSIALVLDATLVRTLLVPASMRLLGRANWWPAR
ncbi:MMPL family transporter [Nocardiopsis valliformis]|uniref:MMPL family transporter n=1 Tax=Nocardiopsis valliformis TaxID=239974 RepID=UPI00034A1BEA|nr:MMPL family transporter [Nocardiopsis valliformis]